MATSKAKILTAVVLSGILACLAMLAFVAVQQVTHSASGTLASGRTVTITARSFWIEIAFERDTATMSAAGDQILVAPNAVYLNQRLWGRLDPASQDIQITTEGGKLTVLADGAAVSPERTP